jgi:hypothetical protein
LGVVANGLLGTAMMGTNTLEVGKPVPGVAGLLIVGC